MKRLCLGLMLLLLISACAARSSGEAPEVNDPASLPWTQVEELARGTSVNLFMWGGDAAINRYIAGFAAQRLSERYGITLIQTPLGDTAEAVNKLVGEKTAGQTSDGSIDLVWINGENFRTLRQGSALYGPWSRQLPHAALISWENASVANDFGYPVDGYEAPWGRAQFVLIYDSARTPDPPDSFQELLAWAQANPGRFTYPAPPDYTGSVFVRHALYELAGGYEKLKHPFDEASYQASSPALWDYLNQLKPALWRGGETYPQSVEQLHSLFANGEVDFSMSYNPVFASGAVERGTFSQTTRTSLFAMGTIANTHYLAIPFNAPNKAGALVVANFLESPEAQIEKARPAVWGDLPVLDLDRLTHADRAALESLPLGPATLDPGTLARAALPELSAEWLERIEQGWQEQVLRHP